MNQAQKDRAWKAFEITFCVALASDILINWKSFLATWFDIAKQIVGLVLVAVVVAFLFGILDSGGSKEEDDD